MEPGAGDGGCVGEAGVLGSQAVDPRGLGEGGEMGCLVTLAETSSGAHCSACLGTKLERYGCPRRLTGQAGSPRD